MTYELHRHDARRISELLDPESVDLVVTSPPYFALRSYRDGGEHYDGQLGSEATPGEFVDNLIACTADWLKLLKPTGSLFVNLSDKYAGSGGHNNATLTRGYTARVCPSCERVFESGRNKCHICDVTTRFPAGMQAATRRNAPDRYNQASDGIPAKSRMGLPWRYALRCIDELGLILRADIVWCLSGGARVYARTPTGDRPIMLRDLVRSYAAENVQLWNGKKWTQVLGWNLSTDTDGALELELRSGERIGCTPGHQWPTGRGLLRADELRVGDVIESCILPANTASTDAPAMLPDDDIGWLVGMYLAEGSRSGTVVQFAGHLDETERHHRLRLIATAYDTAARVYQTSEGGATCNLSGPIIVAIIDRYVSQGTAHTKRLTFHTWQRSNRFLVAVLVGYLEGDGHYDAKNDRWLLSFTHNDELAADLRTIAARLDGRISLRRCATGWRGEWRWSVSQHWNTKNAAEIVAIRASRARQFFDVGVADEPHTFALASGVMTHNSKPNGLPESVTDRVRMSHEYLFHFTRQGRYFGAIDEVREEYAAKTLTHRGGGKSWGDEDNPDNCWTDPKVRKIDARGKVLGSVWTMSSEPLIVPAYRIVRNGRHVAYPFTLDEAYKTLRRLGVRNGRPSLRTMPDHFAAYPSELVRRIVLGWSPSGYCTTCDEPRRPVVDKRYETIGTGRGNERYDRVEQGHGDVDRGAFKPQEMTHGRAEMQSTITGYACACPTTDAPTTPAVVLDPFSGTGTTPAVAHHLGRHGIGVDLSNDYLRLAEWRCSSDQRLRGKVLDRSGIPNPAPPAIGGQLDLFGETS